MRQLDRVLGEALERAWRAGAGLATSGSSSTSTRSSARCTATKKQGAAFGYTRERGYHPLLASRADTGEVLHIRLRAALGVVATRVQKAQTSPLRRGAPADTPERPTEQDRSPSTASNRATPATDGGSRLSGRVRVGLAGRSRVGA